MYKYKNVSDMEQSLIGFGVVAAGDEIETDRAVENPNFKFIGDGVVGTQVAQANVVTEAELVTPQQAEEQI